jgi:hypothetical protein
LAWAVLRASSLGQDDGPGIVECGTPFRFCFQNF